MGPRGLVLTAAFVITVISAIFVLLNGMVFGTLLGRVTLPNIGSVKAIGVGVYWDSSCSNQVTSINWGTVQPGSTKDMNVYIKNEGNAPETLSLETQNWSPAIASTYIGLTWDYNGQVLNVGGVIQVKLTLSVLNAIEGVTNFSFDIVITGSG